MMKKNLLPLSDCLKSTVKIHLLVLPTKFFEKKILIFFSLIL